MSRDEIRKQVIKEISDKIYAMEWLGVDEKRDYMRNLIAWNVLQMAQEPDVPTAQNQGE